MNYSSLSSRQETSAAADRAILAMVEHTRPKAMPKVAYDNPKASVKDRDLDGAMLDTTRTAEAGNGSLATMDSEVGVARPRQLNSLQLCLRGGVQLVHITFSVPPSSLAIDSKALLP